MKRIYVMNLFNLGGYIVEKKLVYFLGISAGILSAIDFLFGSFYYYTLDINGISPTKISYIMAAASITLLIFDFPSGNLSDIFGRKRCAGIGRIVWGGGLVCFGLSTSFLTFLLSIVILNIGVALNSGSISTWAHEFLCRRDKEDIWPRIVGKTSSISNLIKLVINFLFLFIFTFVYFNIFTYIGIFLIVLGIATLLSYKKDENYGNKKEDILESIKGNIVHIKENKNIRTISFINVLSSIFLAGFLILMPYKFTEILNYNSSYLPYLFFACTFFIYIGTLIYGKLIKKNSVEKVYKFNLIFGVIANIIFYFSNNILIFIFGIFLFEVFFIINTITSSSWVYNYLTNDNKSSMISAISALSSASSAIYFIIVGALLEYNLKFILLLILMSIIFILALYNKLPKIEK